MPRIPPATKRNDTNLAPHLTPRLALAFMVVFSKVRDNHGALFGPNVDPVSARDRAATTHELQKLYAPPRSASAVGQPRLKLNSHQLIGWQHGLLLCGFGREIFLGFADEVETAGDADEVFFCDCAVGDL